MYNQIICQLKGDKFSIKKLIKIQGEFSNNSYDRISLKLPVFEGDFVYGGITTALKILNRVGKELRFQMRIIVLNGTYKKRVTFNLRIF